MIMATPLVYPPVSINDAVTPWGVPQHMPGRSSVQAGQGMLPGSTSTPQPGDVDAQPVRDPHHYASLVSQYLPISNLTSAKIVDAPRGRRNLLMIRNSSVAANIFIDFGKEASLFSVLRLVPNQIILFDNVVPQDDVYALADVANGVLSFSYSTILG
jgi:hypothetical protein